MSNLTGNVHEAGGDLLVVIPAPAGWTICWYVPEEDGSTESLPEAMTEAITPQEDEDEDEADEDEEESDAQDRLEMKLVRSWCAARSVKTSVSEDSGEPDHFVWPTREEAQVAADTMMDWIRRKRSAPWADAALASGWTPPAGWTKS